MPAIAPEHLDRFFLRVVHVQGDELVVHDLGHRGGGIDYQEILDIDISSINTPLSSITKSQLRCLRSLPAPPDIRENLLAGLCLS